MTQGRVPSLDYFSNFSFIFPIWRHLFHSTNWHHNCRIPNFYLACLSASPFEIFIVTFVCLQIFIKSLIGKHSRHIIFQYIIFYYSCTRSIVRLPSFCFQVFPTYYLYSPIFFENILWKIIINSFNAIMIKVWTSFYKWYCQMLHNNYYFKNCTLIFIQRNNGGLQHSLYVQYDILTSFIGR